MGKFDEDKLGKRKGKTGSRRPEKEERRGVEDDEFSVGLGGEVRSQPAWSETPDHKP